VRGGRVEAKWIAKAPSADWRNVHVKFQVTVSSASVSGMSSNDFTFRQRPTTGWIPLNVSHPSGGGFGPSDEKHDAALEANRVHYLLKLRTYGDPYSAAQQQAARTQIESVWNGGFANKKFHRTGCKRGRACDCPYDCCKADWHLDINFVAAGEHVAIKVHHTVPPAPAFRSGMNGSGGDWGDPPRNATSTYAHETGHVLGQADEYVGGATDPTGVQPAPPPPGDENLMSTTGNTKLLIRHYRWALKFLNDHAAGDTYETIQP
jgi:hypothetical protein